MGVPSGLPKSHDRNLIKVHDYTSSYIIPRFPDIVLASDSIYEILEFSECSSLTTWPLCMHLLPWRKMRVARVQTSCCQ